MPELGANDNPHRTRMLPQRCCPFSLSPKQASRSLFGTTEVRYPANGRIHFQTFTASNEPPGLSADNLCDANLGLPTQMTKCED